MPNPIRTAIERIRSRIKRRQILGNCVDWTLISQIADKKLTYLSHLKMASIANTCRDIERRGLSGAFIEAGCALGGSSILIGSLKSAHRSLKVYDVFGLIPAPTEEDPDDVQQRYETIITGQSAGINGDKYYGYEEDLLDKVKANFAAFGLNLEARNIHLIEGLLQETMHVDSAVAFAHVDVDWYDPVKTCLERLYPRLIVGGSIILDDYHDWGGCRKAVDEFLRTIVGKARIDDSAGSLKITKISP